MQKFVNHEREVTPDATCNRRQQRRASQKQPAKQADLNPKLSERKERTRTRTIKPIQRGHHSRQYRCVSGCFTPAHNLTEALPQIRNPSIVHDRTRQIHRALRRRGRVLCASQSACSGFRRIEWTTPGRRGPNWTMQHLVLSLKSS
eukprot:6183376-Pleurochrysis_carterae.AAC.3